MDLRIKGPHLSTCALFCKREFWDYSTLDAPEYERNRNCAGIHHEHMLQPEQEQLAARQDFVYLVNDFSV